MLSLRILSRTLLLCCVLAALPLYALRRPDGSSSGNGTGPSSTCPNSAATPFFAQLDGTQSPPPGCTPSSDKNKPNPPSPYPNLVVTLEGTGFTVTLTPALWERGDGQSGGQNPVGESKRTIFLVQFSGASGMHLQSLVIGSRLNDASYVVCATPPNNPLPPPFCISDPSFLLYSETSDPEDALEPTPIDLADAKTTRWDFTQFVPGASLVLVVDGFPKEFNKIDKYANSNTLTAAFFTSSNFLAVVTDASDNTLTAGGLTLKSAPAAKNDLFANAINIKAVPFKSFVNTTATNPTEILSGAGAGNQQNAQSDPIPQDPTTPNAGTACNGTWSTTANRVFRSVWYKFTPSTSNNYAASTADSRYDTGIYVFTGSPSSPTPVACNDDAPTSGEMVQSSYVNFAATAGTTYYIMVSEAPPAPPSGEDSTGTIDLAIPLAEDATLQFTLGVGSGIVLSPNWKLNFPNQAVNTTSAPLPITATNTSSATVNISKFEFVGNGTHEFTETNNCGTSLGPGLHCNINVTFAPRPPGGSYTAYLQLLVSGGTSPTPIELTGFGD